MTGRTALFIGLALTLSACTGAEREPREQTTTLAEAQVEEAAATAETQSALTEPPKWVSQVAAIANAVERRPAAADSILRANNMKRAVFDSLLYEIAANPVYTRAYEALRSK